MGRSYEETFPRLLSLFLFLPLSFSHPPSLHVTHCCTVGGRREDSKMQLRNGVYSIYVFLSIKYGPLLPFYALNAAAAVVVFSSQAAGKGAESNLFPLARSLSLPFGFAFYLAQLSLSLFPFRGIFLCSPALLLLAA